jgi:hypothetical protein
VSAINDQDRARLEEIVRMLTAHADETFIRMAVEVAYRHGLITGKIEAYDIAVEKLRAA